MGVNKELVYMPDDSDQDTTRPSSFTLSGAETEQMPVIVPLGSNQEPIQNSCGQTQEVLLPGDTQKITPAQVRVSYQEYVDTLVNEGMHPRRQHST